jgi:hypothetical protein
MSLDILGGDMLQVAAGFSKAIYQSSILPAAVSPGLVSAGL